VATMSEYRIDLKVRNNIILSKIEEAGYKTVCEFCRVHGMKGWESSIGEFVNMKRSPLNSKGDFFDIIKKIAEILNCMPEDLFSEQQMHTALKTNKRVIKVNEAEMRFMLECNEQKQKLLEEIVEEEQKNKTIIDLLDTLTPREKKVLEMRMGLNGEEESTLEECGMCFNIQSQRVRQIEAKALRKLRHESRSDKIREFLIN
jgi:DNA-directed RNA polymerase sigma subunit (sigma70/sigma32)